MTESRKRTLPTSDLDMQMLVTDPGWSTEDIPKDLREKLDAIIDEDATTITKENLWDLLGYYKRDLRLGNLSTWNNEYEYCRYMLNLAGDLLQSGYVQSFMICLKNVIDTIELSQSKKGWLRGLFQTQKQEYEEVVKNDRDGFFGKNRGKEQ